MEVAAFLGALAPTAFDVTAFDVTAFDVTAFDATVLDATVFTGGRFAAGAWRFDAEALVTGLLAAGLLAALDGVTAAPLTARVLALGRVADFTDDLVAVLEDLGMALLSRSVEIRID